MYDPTKYSMLNQWDHWLEGWITGKLYATIFKEASTKEIFLKNISEFVALLQKDLIYIT